MSESVKHYVEQFHYEHSDDPIVLLLRKYFPEVDCDFAMWVLWNQTAYPFTDELDVYERQLARYARTGQDAMDRSEERMRFESMEWGEPDRHWMVGQVAPTKAIV
jgi:hypothetical protein